MEADLFVVACAVVAFGLLAGRLEGSPLTMPIVFTAIGILVAPDVLGIVDFEVSDEGVGVLAEATLVVVLFTDASRMDLRTIARHHRLAQRLLVAGLPLAIVVGAGVGLLLFPDMPVAAVALLAATLAPTDAALGQAFVSDEAVPGRIRQTLNVESGLNDGLAVPFITVLIDVARDEAGSVMGYVGLFAQLVGLGVVAGAAVGAAGGALLARASARGFTTPTTERLSTIALAVAAYSGAELVGGNGFVAAFVAGLVIALAARELVESCGAFAEAEGHLLALITFLLFGTIAVDVVADVTWEVIVYALASLLLVRPIAVALATARTGVDRATVAYLAWAGPRGLASIVYAVLIAETAGVEGSEEVFTIAAATILLSIALHGSSAAAVSRRYAEIERPHDAPEHHDVPAMPMRLPARRGAGAASAR